MICEYNVIFKQFTIFFLELMLSKENIESIKVNLLIRTLIKTIFIEYNIIEGPF